MAPVLKKRKRSARKARKKRSSKKKNEEEVLQEGQEKSSKKGKKGKAAKAPKASAGKKAKSTYGFNLQISTDVECFVVSIVFENIVLFHIGWFSRVHDGGKKPSAPKGKQMSKTEVTQALEDVSGTFLLFWFKF